MNTFTLLGSFYREDVITDLMANLINAEKKFADWFMKTVCDTYLSEGEEVKHVHELDWGRG